tara:strand:+ start:13942 stop:15681 length:1740 start_codon:yes stop_codon:yes gene_type:complete
MKSIGILITILLSSSAPLFSQTYITNVTLADVEKQKYVANQTVEITNDIITNIKLSKKMKIPKGAIVIDGKGKYLFPGMVDAHVHFFQSGGLYTRPDVMDFRAAKPYQKELDNNHKMMEETMNRYLGNGITTVIDVGASYSYLKQRDQYKNNNKALSVFMTGPLLTTYEPKVYENLEEEEPFSLVKTIEDGRKMVQEQLAYHPDFIKIWYIASPNGETPEVGAKKYLPIIKAIIEEAHKNNLKVAVHATERITAQLAVENGADFLVHSVDDEILKDDFVQLLKTKKTILCPTLIVMDGYKNTFSQQNKFNEYELLNSDPYQLGTLMDSKHLSDTLLINRLKTISTSKGFIENSVKKNATMMTNLKKLSDAGVLIATGTDAGNIGTLHVSSYLNELLAMQESGMSNWQIMQASTINGAKVLNKESEFGTVSVGKKANLVLFNQNPIENIENITKIERVINNGNVIVPNELIKETPEVLVQRQLNAYNQRNIEAFLEPYDDDVEVYNYPDQLQYIGKENMRLGYSRMFDNVKNLHCELKERIVQGNVVIDKERVQFGKKIVEAVAIYHIENNKIKKVYFIN